MTSGAPAPGAARASAAEAVERLGELLIVGVPGTEMTSEIEARLRRLGPSGVIFFAPNFEDAGGRAVCARARGARDARASRARLGRRGGRHGEPARRVLGRAPLGASRGVLGGPPLVRDLAARTLGACSRSASTSTSRRAWTFLEPKNPVIGIRSFGTAPSQVTACGRAAIEGFLSAGVIPVAKHFPGTATRPSIRTWRSPASRPPSISSSCGSSVPSKGRSRPPCRWS